MVQGVSPGGNRGFVSGLGMLLPLALSVLQGESGLHITSHFPLSLEPVLASGGLCGPFSIEQRWPAFGTGFKLGLEESVSN